MDYKMCPFCGELNEIDHKFCIYCGKKFPIAEDTSEVMGDVLNSVDESDIGDHKCIDCPACNALNYRESIECKKCGYLLNEDVKKKFPAPKEKKYRDCPKCGNKLYSNNHICNICEYDFSDLKIDYDSEDNFFEKHPEYEEYRKNIDFFKNINKFNDYDGFLFEFKELCNEKNIDLPFFDIGMVECPQCSEFFSFISPHFIINHSCPHCGNEFDFKPAEGAYCLNCGRPVRENQTECECGYEFEDVKCPNCRTLAKYTDTYCISCGERLISSDFKFPSIKPRGCEYENNKLVLDAETFKRELLKNPYSTNDRIDTNTLHSQHLKHEQILSEICSRWWIVSPTNCKSCQRKIEPFKNNCQTCNIYHYSDDDNGVKELKTIKNNYVETERGIAELSKLKWNYGISDEDLNDYLNSLAPAIGESQLEYMQRLFREWAENSFIKFLIECEWNIYFEDICMNCGSDFEKYNVYCPSCGMKKEVHMLSVLLNDDLVGRESFPHQFDDFSRNVEEICREHGGDICYVSDGIVSCPECLNYFHYLTPEFMDTQRCPHCGVHFDFNAVIYQNEEELEGLAYEEYMAMFYDDDMTI